jgi:NADPH:quinone reductase-like Zn-dependent oxidoreductase
VIDAVGDGVKGLALGDRVWLRDTTTVIDATAKSPREVAEAIVLHVDEAR